MAHISYSQYILLLTCGDDLCDPVADIWNGGALAFMVDLAGLILLPACVTGGVTCVVPCVERISLGSPDMPGGGSVKPLVICVERLSLDIWLEPVKIWGNKMEWVIVFHYSRLKCLFLGLFCWGWLYDYHAGFESLIKLFITATCPVAFKGILQDLMISALIF